HQRWPCACRRKREISSRHAARNLNIYDSIANSVASDRFAQHYRKRSMRHRARNPQFTESAVQRRHMTAVVNEPPTSNLPDFVEPMGEWISAVLDGHLGGVARQITAVDVCDA